TPGVLLALELVSLFFFQAEDGIRDDLVTGVQTCALPISACRSPCSPTRITRSPRRMARGSRRRTTARPTWASRERPSSSRRTGGSEERRVGKECRSRAVGSQYKKESKAWGVEGDDAQG